MRSNINLIKVIILMNKQNTNFKGIIKDVKNKTEEELKDIKKKWKALLLTPNYTSINKTEMSKEQKDIILNPNNVSMKIIACAGAGKTTTAIKRIKYLILEKKILPSKIMVVAFNKTAGEKLSLDIKKEFNDIDLDIDVGTIDSISKKYCDTYLKLDHFIDVGEYAYYFNKYLENGKKRKEILDKYEYIVFDEYQDVNETYHQIVLKFHNNGCKIIVIGDECQNIYQFRNSDLKYFREIDTKINEVKKYEIKTNRRSTEDIVNICNQLMKKNRLEDDTTYWLKMESDKKKYKKPIIRGYKNTVDEIAGCVAYMSKKVNSGKTIAIIARKNKILFSIEEELAKNNIPFYSLISDDENANIELDNKKGITIITIHMSKGLDWDICYLVGMHEGEIPIIRVDTEEQKKDKKLIDMRVGEELRLLYVAMTRAKETLIMSYSTAEKQHQGKNPPAPNINRFLNKINTSYYEFQGTRWEQGSHREYKPYVGKNTENNVMQILRKLTNEDFERMREKGLIPKFTIDDIKNQLHVGKNIPLIIQQNRLHCDYGSFMEYVIRHIFYKNKKIKKDNIVETKVSDILEIGTILLNKEDQKVYDKHDDEIEEFIKSKKSSLKNKEVMKITKKMMDEMKVAEDFNIEIDDVEVTNLRHHLYPYQEYFRNSLIESIRNFKSDNWKTEEILDDLYNISLCEKIIEGRRRLIHLQKFKKSFTNDKNTLSIVRNIQKTFLPLFSDKVRFQQPIKSEEYGIHGIYDMYDKKNKKIVEIKCSNSDDISLKWFLQALVYASIMRMNKKKVKLIEIYNPLKGCLYQINIKEWKNQEKLLKFLQKKIK
jgi:hypothetical protein